MKLVFPIKMVPIIKALNDNHNYKGYVKKNTYDLSYKSEIVKEDGKGDIVDFHI
jgi:hypothetical protein